MDDEYVCMWNMEPNAKLDDNDNATRDQFSQGGKPEEKGMRQVETRTAKASFEDEGGKAKHLIQKLLQ